MLHPVTGNSASISTYTICQYGGDFNLRIPADPNNTNATRGWMDDAVIQIPDHFTIADLDISITVTHTKVFDLQIFLQSPAGTRLCLNSYNLDEYFNGENYTQTVFDDEAEIPIEQSLPPFTGQFRPESGTLLSSFDGQDAFGAWRLQIYDCWFADIGTLDNFQLVVNRAEAFSGAGSGTEQDPYIITNVYQLQEMNNDLDAWYELGNDIDVSETKNWNGGAGFTPIGNQPNYFTGHFDGKRHKITGLYISRSSSDSIGLFGVTGSGSVIKNVGLVNVDVNAGNGCGVGGLVGANYGNGTITNCYSTGSVSGGGDVGGLVGYNCYGPITNCYSTGKVTGSLVVGGLVGRVEYAGGVVNSFWDIQTSGWTTSAGGLGKTTVEMKQKATFTNWDFNTVWDIVEGQTYPYLRENNQFLLNQMVRPVEGYLTSCFGWRNRNGKQEFHNGIDLSRDGINGEKIVAPANGEVIDVGYDDIAGYWIKIQHREIVRLDGSIAQNVSTSYCHLFELPSLQPTDKICQRDVIGKVGSSGDSTGPHLHFIVREDNKAVNPLRYVDYSPRPGKELTCDAFSPIDIIIIDPDGYLISKNLIEIEETATYLEDDLDGDGDLDDQICITDRKVGNYIISVVPESNALSTDTYSLRAMIDGQTMVLAEDVQIQDIPAEPYRVESKLIFSDFDNDTDVDFADLAKLSYHWLSQDCNYPDWCEGADLNYNHFVELIDISLFVEHWLEGSN
jgi:subtilisin-like proprotein convertase family protein